MSIDKENAREQLIEAVQAGGEDALTDYRYESKFSNPIFDVQANHVYDEVTDSESYYEKQVNKLDNFDEDSVRNWIGSAIEDLPDEFEARWNIDESTTIAKTYVLNALKTAKPDMLNSQIEEIVNEFSPKELLNWVVNDENFLVEQFNVQAEKAQLSTRTAELKADYKAYFNLKIIPTTQQAIKEFRETYGLQSIVFNQYSEKVFDFVKSGSLQTDLETALDDTLNAKSVIELDGQYEEFVGKFSVAVKNRVIDLWNNRETINIAVDTLTKRIENNWSAFEQKLALAKISQAPFTDLIDYVNTRQIDELKSKLIDEKELATKQIISNQLTDLITPLVETAFTTWRLNENLEDQLFSQPIVIQKTVVYIVGVSLIDLFEDQNDVNEDDVKTYVKENITDDYIFMQINKSYDYASAKEKAIDNIRDNLGELDEQHDMEWWLEKLNSMIVEDVLYYRKHLEELIAKYED